MRILLVVHGFPPGAVGGTEAYTHDLAHMLAAGSSDDVFVLTREADPSRPEYEVRREVQDGVQIARINNTFRNCASLEDSYANPALLGLAMRAVSGWHPDIAHIQHLTCLSTGLPRAIASGGTPVVMTLNDYWLLCHRGQLLDLDARRCDGPGVEGCSRCIPASAAANPPGSLQMWRAARELPIPGAAAAVRAAARVADLMGSTSAAQRASSSRLAHMRDATASVDCFLAPSQTIADRFSTFGIAPGRLLRCGQGIDCTPFTAGARQRDHVLRLGFVGSLLPSKAPHLLLEAAARLPYGTVTVDLVGAGTSYHGDNSYADTLAPLLARPFVRAHGTVAHDAVPGLLAAIDVLVVPSIWIENAPFVIKEAFAAGVPVVASDLGGMAEIVAHEVNGLLFVPGDVTSLSRQLRRLQAEPGLLERLRSGITPPMTIEEDAVNLRRLYTETIAAKRVPPGVAPRPGHTPIEHSEAEARLSAVVLNYGTAEQTWLAVRSLQTSFVPPASIVVVDNGSRDGSAAVLRRMLEGGSGPAPVTLIETGRNLGFPAGCNVGIEAALKEGAGLVLLVNSDAVLAPDALTLLLAAARTHPSAGILAPLIVSREEPDRIASAGIAYSLTSGRMRSLLTSQPVSAAPALPFEVAAASGCVMLIRGAVLEKVGHLDGAYFFSFEDVDLCLRARSAGFLTVCVPAARAYHEGGRSIGRRSAARIYFATRNHLKLASGLDPNPLRRMLRAGGIVALNTAYVLTSPDAPLVSGLAAVVRGTWHHLLGLYGPDPAA